MDDNNIIETQRNNNNIYIIYTIITFLNNVFIYWYNGMGLRYDDGIDGHSGAISHIPASKARY